MTVEAWVKLQQSTGYVVCKNGNYFLTVGGTVAATFTVDGSNRNVNGVINVPTGQWVHLAITWLKTSTTTGTGTIYVNGVLDTQTNFTGLTTGLISAGYGSKMRIGQNDWSPIGSEMDGKIDSLRISNIARVFTPLYPPSPGAANPPGNLVPNGDFEGGLMGWRLNGYGDMNLVWEATSGAASGQKCLHTLSTAITDFATAPGGGSPPPLISRPIPAHPGRKYTFSCRLKTVGSNLYPQIGVYQCGGPANIASTISRLPRLPDSDHFVVAVYAGVYASQHLLRAFHVRLPRLPVVRGTALRG